MDEKPKKKLFPILIALMVLITAAVVISGIFYLKNDKESNEEKTGIDMKTISFDSIPQICMEIPIDYSPFKDDYVKEFYRSGTASVIVTAEESALSLDEYIMKAIEDYKGVSDEFEISDTRDVTVDNKAMANVTEFNYHIKGMDSSSLTAFVVFIRHDNMVYIITCTAPVDEYATRKPEFEAILDSIWFRGTVTAE